MSLLLIPALIYMRAPIINGSRKKKINTSAFNKFLASLSRFIVRNPGKILKVSALITLILSFGIIFLRIDTNQENYFPKGHPVRSASDIINSKFGGSQTISVMMTGDIKSPEVMKGIDELTLTI